MNINEQRRQEIKQKVNHILEPLIVDLLIIKPTNHLAFMRQWLEERRQYYEEHEQKPTLNFSTTKKITTKMSIVETKK